MAISDNDEISVAPGSQNQSQQTHQPQQQQQAQKPSKIGGVRNLNQLFNRPFSSSAINETLQTVSKGFNELIENEVSKHDPGYRVLVIDNKQSMTALSAIAVCYTVQARGTQYVSVYTILVEGDAQLSNRQANLGTSTIEIITVAGDVADAEMAKRVIAMVQDSYGPGVKIVEASANVLYREGDITDKKVIRNVFATAARACFQALVSEGVISEPAFNSKVFSSSDQLLARVDMNSVKMVNSSTLPVRNDISIQLQAIVQQASQSQPEQVIGLTQVNGFIDLIYDNSNNPMMNQWNNPYMQKTQSYTPNFVITNFSSLLDASPPELQFLAIASSSILMENTGGVAPWMQTFNSHHVEKGEVDTRDIGAVGIEVNFTNDPNFKPMIIDTKSNDFSLQDRYKLINAAMYPNLIYSIDIEEVGDTTYVNLPIVLSCMPGPKQQDAIRHITKVVDELTCNNFTPAWQAATNGNTSEPYFFNDDNRIFTGYYTDKKGERRDIRDIDYLAVLNIVGAKDKSFIKDWSDTFHRRDIPMEIRLDKRRRIINHLLNGKEVIKGYARRVTINPKFMVALTNACRDSNLKFRPSNISMEYYTGTGHGMTNAHQMYGMQAGVNSGLFSYSNGVQNVGGNSMPMPGFNGFNRNF